MKRPEVVFTKSAPKTGFSEGTESPIAHVVRVGVYLRDMKDFPVFNRVFKEYFAGVQPARTTVEAAPPRAGVNVEIDAIAWIPE
jgi:2-iminobutanoate/2-iminopropanoate deaminase